MKTQILPFLVVFILTPAVHSQQTADEEFSIHVIAPAYSKGEGPIVYIDEGHHNFHTLEGRYKPFAILLEKDGYRVRPYKGNFEMNKLEKGKILVIANALHKRNIRDWTLPTPSAFTEEEIVIIKNWVHQGVVLFLIADHMPMPGAAADMANAFGFTFYNGFARNPVHHGPDTFRKSDGALCHHVITKGRNPEETVDSIISFTGQAFEIPESAEPLMIFPQGYEILLPDTAWRFHENTPRLPVEGWSQGAVMNYGNGKVAIFGEAAMFTAQVAGENKIRVGINSPTAPQNHQFLLNLIHWLDGIIE